MASIELTNDEKIGVIESHMKNLQYNKYNAQMTVVQEEALTSPDQATIDKSNATIAKSDLQIAALEAELALLKD